MGNGANAVLFTALLWSAEARAISEGEAAPDFTISHEHSLSDSRGRKVLLEFWVSWCGSCRASLEQLNSISLRHPPSELEVVAVNLDERGEDAAKLLPLLGETVRKVADPGASIAERYGVVGLPALFLIDEKGRVLASANGFSGRGAERIGELIGEGE